MDMNDLNDPITRLVELQTQTANRFAAYQQIETERHAAVSELIAAQKNLMEDYRNLQVDLSMAQRANRQVVMESEDLKIQIRRMELNQVGCARSCLLCFCQQGLRQGLMQPRRSLHMEMSLGGRCQDGLPWGPSRPVLICARIADFIDPRDLIRWLVSLLTEMVLNSKNHCMCSIMGLHMDGYHTDHRTI